MQKCLCSSVYLYECIYHVYLALAISDDIQAFDQVVLVTLSTYDEYGICLMVEQPPQYPAILTCPKEEVM